MSKSPQSQKPSAADDGTPDGHRVFQIDRDETGSVTKMVYWGTVQGKTLTAAHKHGPALANMMIEVGARLAAQKGKKLFGSEARIQLHPEVKPEDFNGAILNRLPKKQKSVSLS